MRNSYLHVFCALVFACGFGVACGQSWPAKPIRLIMPFPPGGGPDLVMRRAGTSLAPRLGQPLVIENRPGGNFVIGAEACARSTPDGYSICYILGSQMSVNPHVLLKLPYDPDKDFVPITSLYGLINGLFVSATTPVATLKEFEAYVRARPGKINMSTHGPNTSTDMYRRWLNELWSTDMVGVGYKDGTAMISALIAGDIQFTWIGVFNALGQLQGKRVKLLAVSSVRRYPAYADVPTFVEAGLPPVPLSTWQGLGAPAGTPEPVIKRLNAEFVRLFNEREFGDYLMSQGLETLVGTPEEFAAMMKKDRADSGELIRKLNIPRE